MERIDIDTVPERTGQVFYLFLYVVDGVEHTVIRAGSIAQALGEEYTGEGHADRHRHNKIDEYGQDKYHDHHRYISSWSAADGAHGAFVDDAYTHREENSGKAGLGHHGGVFAETHENR